MLEAASTREQSSRRILIADDEIGMAQSLSRVLRGAGFDVTTVSDGTSAADALKREDFDVVLSDIHMPGLNGVDLLRVVRERNLDVPVVLMTAEPHVDTAATAVELGALQYLVKPIASDKLFSSIERAAKLRLMARMKRTTKELIGDAPPRAPSAWLSEQLDRALASMWMAYQPIVAKSGVLFGYEALLRSKEPSLPHPGAVIGAAEQLERLPEVGRRVRELVAAQIDGAPEHLTFFVNLHTRDLLDESLLSADAPLSRHATRVVLEVTERAAVDEIKDVRARIARLRSFGFRIAIDDLGAGYAGLTSFALLEPEIVKFDMSLVRNVHMSPIRQKLIGSMCTLCRDMGMMVVAEGVESAEERNALLELSCDLFQGFMLGRPGPAFPAASW